MSEIEKCIDLLNECEMLSSIQRSGFAFLGSGRQSVAEHSYQTTMVAFVLARLHPDPVDLHKLVMMCLFHDLPEARMGDLNYVQKKYVSPQLNQALTDIESASSLGPEIVASIKEYEEGTSLEAQLAHDADQLELLLILKQEEERGNQKATQWMDNLEKRLQTEIAKKTAKVIRHRPSDAWWHINKSDPYWITGGKKPKK